MASVRTSRTVGSMWSYRSACATCMRPALVYRPNQNQTPQEMKK